MWRRLKSWLPWNRRQREADLERELRNHLELEAKERQEAGMSSEEAAYAARRALGNTAQIKEDVRAAWGFQWLETFLQDLRYGLRQLRRNPGFTTVAVLTLALGIGANTTIFSAVSAFLLRKPRVKDPNRLYAISSKSLDQGYDLLRVSPPDFKSYQEQNKVFQGMAAVQSGRSSTITGKREPETVAGDRVTPNYFKVIGVMPSVGRAFLPSEGQAGNDHVVILSHGLWSQRFKSNPNAIGTGIEINHVPYTIVGVMPRGAAIPMPWVVPRLWTPLTFSDKGLSASARGKRDLDMVLGRLKPGVTGSDAQGEMEAISHRLAETYPKTDKGWGVTVITLQEYLIRKPKVRAAAVMLMAMVGFVLLIVCANIAGLLLARGAARAHEMAVRTAVGAGRMRLIRQLLVESLIIAGAGGTMGLILSFWGIDLLRDGFSFNTLAREMARYIHLDHKTLVFTVTVSLFTTVLFGLIPAVRASNVGPADALSETGRASSSGPTHLRLRSLLVTMEIAIAVALLAGAGIMAREVRQELGQKLGFNPQSLLVAGVNLKSHKYDKPAARISFFKQVTEKIESLPGVESASLATATPLTGDWSTAFSIVGHPPLPESKRPRAQNFLVGPNYFHTMQIPLIRGRDFSESDNAHTPVVAIVNSEFAHAYFPKGGAIGHQIQLDNRLHSRAQIVGIVGDVLAYYGEFKPRPQVYESCFQNPVPEMSFVVRSDAAPTALAAVVRRTVWSVDKDQPIGTVQTMNEIAAGSQGGDKLMVALMGIFAALAIILAAVGIYGIVAYSVSRRTHEIGVRLALGAQEKVVVRLMLRQGGWCVVIGCAFGLALALPLPWLFGAVFPGFPIQGPLVPVAVVFVVGIVSLLATYIPARRAAKVDPMVALRYE